MPVEFDVADVSGSVVSGLDDVLVSTLVVWCTVVISSVVLVEVVSELVGEVVGEVVVPSPDVVPWNWHSTLTTSGETHP